MRIYCNCNFCQRKIHLASSAKSRQQLANSRGVNISVDCNFCKSQNQINVNLVYAESSNNKTQYITIAGGGILGAIAGPIGVLIGLTAGGLAGSVTVSRENEAVRRFNSNYL
jgi:hypothetical protein